jgi:hypothetical protein
MKDLSESLQAAQAAELQTRSGSGHARSRVANLRGRPHEDILLPLVRLLARQAAREWIGHQPEHRSIGATSPGPVKKG